MSFSRRDFLRASSAAAAAGLVGYGPAALRPLAAASEPSRPFLPVLDNPDVREIAMTGLTAAKEAGARYADVRVSSGRTRETFAFDRQLGGMRHTTELQFGVRVLVDGAWGFASSSHVNLDEAGRVARLAVEQARENPYGVGRGLRMAAAPVVADGRWETPIDKDPWEHSVQEQISLQLEANEIIVKIKEGGEPLVDVSSAFAFSQTDYAFASSEGSYIVQRFNSFGGRYSAGVRAEDRQSFYSMTPESFKTGGYGWEAIEGLPFGKDAAQAVEDAKTMVSAKPVEVGRYDVVLDAAAVRGVLNASIVRALEYDRVIGYEMHAGGTSYIGPPDEALGQYDFKNHRLNLRATGIVPRGGGTYMWDAEGVAPEDFVLIREGVVVDYFTTREFAPELDWWYRRNGSPVRSHGCAGSGASAVIQVVAPSTAILDPSAEDNTVEDMISGIDNGILFSRGGGASMDPALLNMQFWSGGWSTRSRRGSWGIRSSMRPSSRGPPICGGRWTCLEGRVPSDTEEVERGRATPTK